MYPKNNIPLLQIQIQIVHLYSAMEPKSYSWYTLHTSILAFKKSELAKEICLKFLLEGIVVVGCSEVIR